MKYEKILKMIKYEVKQQQKNEVEEATNRQPYNLHREYHNNPGDRLVDYERQRQLFSVPYDRFLSVAPSDRLTAGHSPVV